MVFFICLHGWHFDAHALIDNVLWIYAQPGFLLLMDTTLVDLTDINRLSLPSQQTRDVGPLRV